MPGVSNLGISHIFNSELWKSKKEAHITLCLLAVAACVSRSEGSERFFEEKMKFVVVLENVGSTLKMDLEYFLKYESKMINWGSRLYHLPLTVYSVLGKLP